ncbi:MAG TPA: S53 family peptidase [Streptosporangiaceae bacterium]
MRARSHVSTVLAVSAASAVLAGGIASAATVHPDGNREVLASTAPVAGQNSALSALAQTSNVQVNVFIGRDLTGLAAVAKAVSDPASSGYQHYLTPAQVRARFGATAAQQRAVAGWLHGSGLTVGYHDGFAVSATGTTAQAEAAVRARLELSRPNGATEQVVSAQAMSAPASVAGAISTVRVAPAVIPMGHHEPMKPVSHAVTAGIKEACSNYYGQKPANGTPTAFGKRLPWAPCGYLPQQLRSAYGATKARLTGKGVSLAIMSEDNDSTALSDTNHWARTRHFPQFRPGQYAAHIAPHAAPGVGDGESALDIESSHGMAPDARVNYVVGNGKITGDRLLDSLYTIVADHMADVVSSSWYEGYMPVPKSMINAWETVLERATVEGITVNFATGDYGDTTPLQYPGSDPWITTIGGTSVAIGASGQRMWETGWETDEAGIKNHNWSPAPPGHFLEGSTGGVSGTFPEPYYQAGIVSQNKIKGHAMRVVPDVSALGDWNLGYQIGLSVPTGPHKRTYENQVNGGTSLSSPMFTGFEADLIQGRGGIALGFANPALYDLASTPAFYDITGDPQGQGNTEADIYGPAYGQGPTLSTMGQCASTHHLYCTPGYDTVSGIGTPGPAFFHSFGSHPK